ncbi:uncharacterized protein proca1 [Hemiscyllium ocellatum]|uniref:uncharacterized protein proca1 n=1 Tax=Hemiscyllium ocellatum TaxID=170820 RepID=UPI002967561A|nr:uncharacterized protein proca1 [Hemiscyllium ocellatum]
MGALSLALLLLSLAALSRQREPSAAASYLSDGRYCAEARGAGYARISDGTLLLRLQEEEEREAGRPPGCSVSAEPRAVSSFMRECELRAAPLPPGTELRDTWSRQRSRCQAGPEHTPLRRSKRGFTYPGTLWCGAGNNADSYDHLGEFAETDKCCREHDHCEHVIHPFAYSYGHRNLRLYTLSHCDCDTELKRCLRKVNDTSSMVVGQAFFNVLEVPCFDLAFKEQCVERYWYGWCKKYDHVLIAVPRESGLYDYGGELIDLTETQNPASDSSTSFSSISNIQSFTAAPETSKPGATWQQSTLGQTFHAAEDVLKVMVSVTPSSAPSTVPSPVSNTENKTHVTLDKAKKKKGRKSNKRRKGKGRKKNHKAKLYSKTTEATNVLPILEKKVPNKENYFTEIEKIRNNEFNHLFDNSLDLGIKENAFNDVMNDESYRVDSFTQVYQMPSVAATKPIRRFQSYGDESFIPLAFTQVPNSEFYSEGVTVKLPLKLQDAHQLHREEAFTQPPTKPSHDSHFNKQISVLTVLMPGQHRAEVSTPLTVQEKLKVATNVKLKANQSAPPSERKNKKPRRKRKGRRRKHKKSKESKLILPTASSKTSHDILIN